MPPPGRRPSRSKCRCPNSGAVGRRRALGRRLRAGAPPAMSAAPHATPLTACPRSLPTWRAARQQDSRVLLLQSCCSCWRWCWPFCCCTSKIPSTADGTAGDAPAYEQEPHPAGAAWRPAAHLASPSASPSCCRLHLHLFRAGQHPMCGATTGMPRHGEPDACTHNEESATATGRFVNNHAGQGPPAVITRHARTTTMP